MDKSSLSWRNIVIWRGRCQFHYGYNDVFYCNSYFAVSRWLFETYKATFLETYFNLNKSNEFLT